MGQTIESILVPTDGSAGAQAGARRGIDLAGTLGADLHILSVMDTSEIGPSLTSYTVEDRSKQEQLIEDEAERAVEAITEVAREHLSNSVTSAVERGVPAETIVEYADTHDVDIIVMGTHGRTGLERVLLGSVAEKTLRTASVPVVTVPPKADIANFGETEYDDILLPVDGSEGAEVAIDWGITLAKVYDATVHTVYSVDTSWFLGADETADIYDTLAGPGEEALEAVREAARTAGVSVRGNVGSGPAARMILSYSEDHDIDLIVMGTHGRSGAKRYLIGSVTETVVRHAEAPVCCVPMNEG